MMTHIDRSFGASLGALPNGPFELRFATTLFLILLGLANIFGALQVKNFAAFSPGGIASTVAPEGPTMSSPDGAATGEVAVDLDQLNSPPHHIERQLLVQDSHVHLPAYALTAAALSLIIFGLELSSEWRSMLIGIAFTAPFADFLGLWGAHFFPSLGTMFGSLAMIGGFGMGLAYATVAAITLYQCWWPGRLRQGPAGPFRGSS